MSAEEKQEEPAISRKKPFKLCFAPDSVPGRSNIQIGKPLKLPNMITRKFYCIDKIDLACSDEDLKKHIEYLNVKGPRDLFEDSVTENQRYGWYQVQFTDLDRTDRRLHFAKRMNPIVKEHLMNYENIR